MSDKYLSFTQSPIGQVLVKNLGLPRPVEHERYAEGDPLVKGTVLLGGRGRLVESLPGLLGPLGVETVDEQADGARYPGLVFDASGLTDPADQERAAEHRVALVVARQWGRVGQSQRLHQELARRRAGEGLVAVGHRGSSAVGRGVVQVSAGSVGGTVLPR
jgi:hypothetical protein